MLLAIINHLEPLLTILKTFLTAINHYKALLSNPFVGSSMVKSFGDDHPVVRWFWAIIKMAFLKYSQRDIYISNWWLTYPLKNDGVRQIGSSSRLLGKIKNVPNHQPDMIYEPLWKWKMTMESSAFFLDILITSFDPGPQLWDNGIDIPGP